MDSVQGIRSAVMTVEALLHFLETTGSSKSCYSAKKKIHLTTLCGVYPATCLITMPSLD